MAVATAKRWLSDRNVMAVMGAGACRRRFFFERLQYKWQGARSQVCIKRHSTLKHLALQPAGHCS